LRVFWDFSIALSLTPQQLELARNLVIRLVWHYDPEQAVRKGYKPAALIQATLQYVASPDTFLTFFLSYIYEALFSNEQYAVDFDINHTISYLDGFASWDSERIQNLNEALEKFAEYIVDNFLLPRMSNSPLPIHNRRIFICEIQSEPRLSRHHNRHPPHYHPYRALLRLEQGSVYLFYDRAVSCVIATVVLFLQNSIERRLGNVSQKMGNLVKTMTESC
jgi:hypothetical protein